MSETLDKELDNMEQVDEGSNPVTKNAKPGDPIDTSKGGATKVIDVNTEEEEGGQGTKEEGERESGSVKKEGAKSGSTKEDGA